MNNEIKNITIQGKTFDVSDDNKNDIGNKKYFYISRVSKYKRYLEKNLFITMTKKIIMEKITGKEIRLIVPEKRINQLIKFNIIKELNEATGETKNLPGM